MFISLKRALTTTVGSKFLTAISGLGLAVFVILHLAGNLTLFIPGGEAFNLYAEKLKSLGPLFYIGEIGLLFIIVLHIVTAIRVKRSAKKARPIEYKEYHSKKGPSKLNFMSQNMIISGLLLAFFMVVHIWQFRFGPGMEEGYVTTLHGQEARDFYRLIVETFKSPFWVVFYCGFVLFLGMHLRHGFWSAFQSLGASFPRFSSLLYCFAALLAVVLTVGFFVLPLYIYFFGEI